MLQLMLEDPRPISRMVADAPRYVIIKDKLDRPAAPLDAVYEKLRAAFPDAEVDTQDGLRLGWPDKWVHVRPSGTEPVVRVIAEAITRAAAAQMVEDARQQLATLV
jgi:phosphomannomutase